MGMFLFGLVVGVSIVPVGVWLLARQYPDQRPSCSRR